MGIFNNDFSLFKLSNLNQTQDTSKNDIVDIQFNKFDGFSKVNKDVALKLSALYSGVNLISETIAALPIYKYKIDENGSKIRVKEKINYLINRNCNDYCSAFDMKDILVKSAILEGNGFILIIRDKDFNIQKLVPLKHSECNLRQINGTDEYMYYVSKQGYVGEYQYYEILNLCINSDDAINGKGVLELGREVIGLGQEQQKFLGTIISNGSYVKGVLTLPSNVTENQKDQIRERFRKFYSGKYNGNVLTLTDDTKYQNISLSPADIELLKMQEFNISEIARLLKISPHMIGGEQKSGNYGSLEQSNLQFLQYTLLPYIRRIEELFNQYLLTEEEKESGEYYFEFNIDNLLRINKKDEIDYYTKAIDAGIMSINEVRTKLNLNKEEGLDIFTLSKFNSIVKDGQIVNTVMNETIQDQETIQDTDSEE